MLSPSNNKRGYEVGRCDGLCGSLRGLLGVDTIKIHFIYVYKF